jgi:amino acid transporter/nucleotide-binding universal stress UspA family protein
MSDNPLTPSPGNLAERLRRPIEVIVVSSVMFTFISYWRTAAVVLCDLASTAYYIGGIAEGAIGACAPWFILAVMLFSYVVRSIYIESCSLFVRGGVYRVVKEAMGGFLAKLSVSALMFDYVLTGPISGMSAGQYIMGLVIDTLAILNPHLALSHDTSAIVRRWGAVAIACLITLYFFRQNMVGLHESSNKALKIMVVTTIMAIVMLAWCGATLIVRGPVNQVPLAPDLRPKFEHASMQGVNRATGEKQEVWQRDPATDELVPRMTVDRHGKPRAVPKLNEATGEQEDPLGFIPRLCPSLAEKLRQPGNWWSIVGVIGLLIAFGHSILAMSGEETLAQVYREVESPKLRNFKKAAFIVFVYSLLLTAGISFLAVLLIPDEVRMKLYADNLIGGLAMNVIGPPLARLLLNAFVVVVGFLILAGAVNTAMIGSNGVLNRVAEDGVLPNWFLKPHRRYGTTHRLLYLIVTLQLITIVASRGDMYVLGEAYAFGVVWSFVFKALAMVVLRFKDRSPREFKVPLNFRVRGVELPIGLIVVFLVLLATAVLNFLTKEVASVAGSAFTAVFLTVFVLSEHYHEKKRGAAAHQHLEQFNRRTTDEFDPDLLHLSKPYRKLVAIRSTQNLFMLEKALLETDPLTTDVIVMTAKPLLPGSMSLGQQDLDRYDRELMTAVVNRAETIGKEVKPLIVPTNNPLFAVVNTAKALGAQELVLGSSNKFNADDQLEQIAFYWMNVCEGRIEPLTVRLLSSRRDAYLDLGGGNRIPRISERQARSIEELRSAGVGVSRALLVHPGTAEGSDLFKAVITLLDPRVAMTVVSLPLKAGVGAEEGSWVQQDVDRALQLKREIEFQTLPQGDPAQEILKLARSEEFNLVILGSPSKSSYEEVSLNPDYIVEHAPCWVCVVTPTPIPRGVDDGGPPRV